MRFACVIQISLQGRAQWPLPFDRFRYSLSFIRRRIPRKTWGSNHHATNPLQFPFGFRCMAISAARIRLLVSMMGLPAPS